MGRGIKSRCSTQVVQKAVGAVFARVLEDAGVFKRDVEGQEGFTRFIKTL